MWVSPKVGNLHLTSNGWISQLRFATSEVSAHVRFYINTKGGPMLQPLGPPGVYHGTWIHVRMWQYGDPQKKFPWNGGSINWVLQWFLHLYHSFQCDFHFCISSFSLIYSWRNLFGTQTKMVMSWFGPSWKPTTAGWVPTVMSNWLGVEHWPEWRWPEIIPLGGACGNVGLYTPGVLGFIGWDAWYHNLVRVNLTYLIQHDAIMTGDADHSQEFCYWCEWDQ